MNKAIIKRQFVNWQMMWFCSFFLLFFFVVYLLLWFSENSSAYTAFAACEYVVIVTNVMFHGTAIIDFAPFSLAYARTDLIAVAPHTHSSKQKPS